MVLSVCVSMCCSLALPQSKFDGCAFSRPLCRPRFPRPRLHSKTAPQINDFHFFFTFFFFTQTLWLTPMSHNFFFRFYFLGVRQGNKQTKNQKNGFGPTDDLWGVGWQGIFARFFD